MPIYTKKGDKGETSLIDGRRVSKASAIPNAIGTVDELNAHIGMAKSMSQEKTPDSYVAIEKSLAPIQEDLFVIGSYLAGNKVDLNKINDRVKNLEIAIDLMTNDLSELRNFILPGGSTVGAQFHVARTVCRRAERVVVEVEQNEIILKYLNRLSDFLFTCARMVNHELEVEDVVWKT